MEIKLREEFIKLGQAIKAAGLVEDGVEAKVCDSRRSGESKPGGGNSKRQKIS